jgi:hypothetical protein
VKREKRRKASRKLQKKNEHRKRENETELKYNRKMYHPSVEIQLHPTRIKGMKRQSCQ